LRSLWLLLQGRDRLGDAPLTGLECLGTFDGKDMGPLMAVGKAVEAPFRVWMTALSGLAERGLLRLPDARLAACHFAYLILSIPQDRAMFCAGERFTTAELEGFADAGVQVPGRLPRDLTCFGHPARRWRSSVPVVADASSSQCLRPTPPHSAAGLFAWISELGRHCWTRTSPGSTISSPSKNCITSA